MFLNFETRIIFLNNLLKNAFKTRVFLLNIRL